jgi:hypothetical protein
VKHVIIVLFLACTFLKAQDTIRFRNGDIRVGKVSEVSTTEIKYLRPEAPTGPPYAIELENVYLVKYQNGYVDSFNVKEPKKVAALSNPPEQKVISREGKIVIKKLDLIYQTEPVDDYKLRKLIEKNTSGDKKNLLLGEYEKIKEYQRKQYLFKTVGLVGGGLIIAGGIVAAIYNIENQNSGIMLFAGFNLGVATMVSGTIMGGKFKKKRLKQRVTVAQIYNDEYEFK